MKIKSVADLVEMAGGLTETAKMLGTSPQNVLHWRKRNKLPAHMVERHQRVLLRKGYELPTRLWLAPPRKAATEAGENAS